MEVATKLGLPWRLLREKLAPPDLNTSLTDVNYKKTLEMLETDLIVKYIIHIKSEKKIIKLYVQRKLHTLVQRQWPILCTRTKAVWKLYFGYWIRITQVFKQFVQNVRNSLQIYFVYRVHFP